MFHSSQIISYINIVIIKIQAIFIAFLFIIACQINSIFLAF